jgi:DNA-binding Xre family transcriptional regulator
LATRKPPKVVKHGTLSGYIHGGCRQTCCATIGTAYRRELTEEKRRGAPSRLVDSTPAKEHLLDLIDQGMTKIAIAEALGVSKNVPNQILASTKMSRQRLERILAIETHHGEHRFVDATTSRTRLRSIARMGYSLPWVAQQTAISHDAINGIAVGETKKVRPKTADAISALYSELYGTTGPCRRTKAWANKKWPSTV